MIYESFPKQETNTWSTPNKNDHRDGQIWQNSIILIYTSKLYILCLLLTFKISKKQVSSNVWKSLYIKKEDNKKRKKTILIKHCKSGLCLKCLRLVIYCDHDYIIDITKIKTREPWNQTKSGPKGLLMNNFSVTLNSLKNHFSVIHIKSLNEVIFIDW